jgi:hypothetical protein
MNRYHTGYYLTFSEDFFTPDEYSRELIEDSRLKLVESNYVGKDWKIEWLFNKKRKGLEFIINAESFEIAQNVLFNVLCSAAVINGTNTWDNDAHYAHEFGTIENVKSMDLLNKPVYISRDLSIPSYFYLTVLASKDYKLANAIVKYQLSTEIYSQQYMDLHGEINWKTTVFNFTQMRFAYAIITAYSVIEELGLAINIDVSKDRRSKIDNGDWNPEVLADLLRRLKSSNINVNDDISWMIRGEETEIEKKRPIKTTREAEWASSEDDMDDLYMKVKDGYVYLPDAINHISYLRSRIASHSVGERIMNLSVFDVANAQFLARRLILERTGLWKLATQQTL